MTTFASHSERACYLRGCRQPECVAANYRYTKRLRLNRERGIEQRIDPAPAQQRIKALQTAGWTQAQIARAANLSHSVVRSTACGEVATISRRTASQILGIAEGPPPPDARFIDATGSTRRIRALIAIGYSAYSLTRHLGLSECAIGIIVRGDRPRVCATTAAVIAKRYRHLSRTPGTDNRSRIIARRKGWHGPLAWDDSTIDDPAAQPEVDKPYQPPAKNGRDSMRMAELEHLLALGESEAAIAKQMGSSEAYIHDLVIALRNRKTATDDMRKAA